MSLKDRLNTQSKSILNNELINSKALEKEDAADGIPPVVEGLGILDAFFVDENLNSIYVSSAKNIYVERKGIVHKSTSTFRDNVQLTNLIKKSAAKAGVEFIESSPYLNFNYREGINVSATLPPISDIPIMFIKSYQDSNATIKYFQENKTISKEIAMVLEALATTKLNILIAGNSQSLKTSTLSMITKLLPINGRNDFIDFRNEISGKIENCVNYDFLNIRDEKTRLNVLKLIFDANPDRVVINDCNEKILSEVLSYSSLGYSGIITNINATSPEDAIDNVAKIILKYNSNMDFETARKYALKSFDIIIFCSKCENGFRTISKICEIDYEDKTIKDVFYLNENQEHSSCGYVPNFCNSISLNNLAINSGIFDGNYKHTYNKNSSGNFQPCNNLIKKMQENVSKETVENSSYDLNSDEIVKKAQEKFEELKKNARNFEIQKETTESFEPQNTENNEFNLNG